MYRDANTRTVAANRREFLLAGELTRLVWTAVRLPILALLVILEPVVRLVLAAGALLTTLTAGFYALVRPATHVPVWGMLAIAVGCFLLLALYYVVLNALRG